jgi:hypothetical protein
MPRSRPLVAADLSSSGAISTEEASNSILAPALANSGAKLQTYVIKCNANWNEKMPFDL